MEALLETRWRERFERVGDLLDRLLVLLQSFDAPDEAVRRARQARDAIDDLFLLVVAGEFNAGKSALINAILGDRYLEEGVTPTTRQIQVIRSPGGPTDAAGAAGSDGIVIRSIAAPLLADLQIVDTPGTNAIVREHEVLTRDFIPRSDLVIFVTSADRPFTESERLFLETIHAWGKKIVFVLNKIDILEDEAARREVVSFVRQGAQNVTGVAPIVFPLSARAALRRKLENLPPPADWASFESWVMESLTAEERLRLKLDSPLGVVERLTSTLEQASEERLTVLRADKKVLEHVDATVAVFEQDLESSFEHRLDTIDNLIGRLRERGEVFLDERFRLSRVRELLSQGRLQSDFEREVIGDIPAAIESEVAGLVDWLVDREHAQWEAIREQLVARASSDALKTATRGGTGSFAARRASLLAGVGSQAERLVDRFDPETESLRLVTQVREAITGTAVAEVGAIGLGLVLKALLTTAVADATGILAAGVVAALGLTIIPYRRRQAVDALRNRTQQLREELREALSTAFERELQSTVERMRETVAPYGRFVRAEHDRVADAKSALAAIRTEAASLKS